MWDPFTWLLLQAASVVAGILLAFGIDAWWEQRTDNIEKNVQLQSLKSELTDQIAIWNDEQKFRIESKKSAKALLAAIAAGRYNDSEKSLDHRLADLMWMSGLPKSAILESFMSGGYLASVENEHLRYALITYRASFEAIDWMNDRESRAFEEMITPFLTLHASLPQIHNTSTVKGMPGLDGYGADPQEVLPLGAEVDHSELLHNREFAGIVVRRHWLHEDILVDLPAYTEGTKELVSLIDQELSETT